MIFRQLFEPESCTYTYLLGCPDTRKAMLIDPVLDSVERDLSLLQQLELSLELTIETHIHADHVTSAARLRSLTGSKAAWPAASAVGCADLQVAEGCTVAAGRIELRPLFTPGHTDDHHSYLLDFAGTLLAFTGDSLLIDGCGRTDFQNGDAATLYASIHEKLFALPDETLVYPAHDYNHRRVSSVGQERDRNPRLGGGRTVEEFTQIMAGLDLPRPAKIDIAVPANRRCGALEES